MWVWYFPCGLVVNNPPAMQGTWVQSFDQEDPLVEEMANNSGVLAWKIPQAQKSGRVQSIESQRVRCDRLTEHSCTQACAMQTENKLKPSLHFSML